MMDSAPGQVAHDLLAGAAALFLSNRQYQPALAVAQAAVLISPHDSQAWLVLAAAQRSLGNQVEATTALERVVRLDSGNLPALLALAELYALQDRGPESEALTTMVLLRERDDPKLRTRARALSSRIARAGHRGMR